MSDIFKSSKEKCEKINLLAYFASASLSLACTLSAEATAPSRTFESLVKRWGKAKYKRRAVSTSKSQGLRLLLHREGSNIKIIWFAQQTTAFSGWNSCSKNTIVYSWLKLYLFLSLTWNQVIKGKGLTSSKFTSFKPVKRGGEASVADVGCCWCRLCCKRRSKNPNFSTVGGRFRTASLITSKQWACSFRHAVSSRLSRTSQLHEKSNIM